MPNLYNKHYNNAPPGAVYIGRPSRWGNKFSVEEFGRDLAVHNHREWLLEPAQEPLREAIRKHLRGKDLVCWCAPLKCHGELLLEIANKEG